MINEEAQMSSSNSILLNKVTRQSDSSSSYVAYRDLIQLVEMQKFDDLTNYTNQLRDDSDFDADILRRLFSHRVSILNGNTDLEALVLPNSSVKWPWIKAEISFVNGLLSFHKNDFKEGLKQFDSAASVYKDCGIYDRFLLSLFNSYVAKVNSNKLNTSNERFHEIQQIERQAMAHRLESNIAGILALVIREKAVLYFQLQKYRACLSSAAQSAELFREAGTFGDLHLSLLLASLAAHKIEDKEKTLLYFEQLIPPFEGRVLFAYDVLNYILTSKNKPDLKSYPTHSPFWLEQLEQLSNTSSKVDSQSSPIEHDFIFDMKENKLIVMAQNKVYKLAPKNLEARLIQLLAKTKGFRRSRYFLIENLWPDFSRSENLDNRLHQLIFRIKKKYGLHIHFDGTAYEMKSSLKLS